MCFSACMFVYYFHKYQKNYRLSNKQIIGVFFVYATVCLSVIISLAPINFLARCFFQLRFGFFSLCQKLFFLIFLQYKNWQANLRIPHSLVRNKVFVCCLLSSKSSSCYDVFLPKSRVIATLIRELAIKIESGSGQN